MRNLMIGAAVMAMTTALSASAQQRDLDAHEHGVGQLNIAIEKSIILMELEAPGADIVGFEHPAKSDQDKKAIEDALAVLSKPMDLFKFTDEAQCTVSSASVELEGDAEHDEEAHKDEDDHGHGDDEKHADGHEDHDDEASHTEFHGEYKFTCALPSKLTGIDFPYFAKFQNAKELEVQLITGKGSNRYEVERDAPNADLSGMM